jgi:hypothetical protein
VRLPKPRVQRRHHRQSQRLPGHRNQPCPIHHAAARTRLLTETGGYEGGRGQTSVLAKKGGKKIGGNCGGGQRERSRTLRKAAGRSRRGVEPSSAAREKQDPEKSGRSVEARRRAELGGVEPSSAASSRARHKRRVHRSGPIGDRRPGDLAIGDLATWRSTATWRPGGDLATWRRRPGDLAIDGDLATGDPATTIGGGARANGPDRRC